jgi:hypothetical protein
MDVYTDTRFSMCAPTDVSGKHSVVGNCYSPAYAADTMQYSVTNAVQ